MDNKARVDIRQVWGMYETRSLPDLLDGLVCNFFSEDGISSLEFLPRIRIRKNPPLSGSVSSTTRAPFPQRGDFKTQVHVTLGLISTRDTYQPTRAHNIYAGGRGLR